MWKGLILQHNQRTKAAKIGIYKVFEGNSEEEERGDTENFGRIKCKQIRSRPKAWVLLPFLCFMCFNNANKKVVRLTEIANRLI